MSVIIDDSSSLCQNHHHPYHNQYGTFILDRSCHHHPLHYEDISFVFLFSQNPSENALLHVQHRLSLHDDVNAYGGKDFEQINLRLVKILILISTVTVQKICILMRFCILQRYTFWACILERCLYSAFICLQVLVFCMPPDSGEKIALGVTVTFL